MYRYLGDITQADAAFEATAISLEELFKSAAQALVNTMVSDLNSIEQKDKREIRFTSNLIDQSDASEELLHSFLEKIIFFKDAEQLLLLPRKIKIYKSGEVWNCDAVIVGERLDPSKHELLVDVKAVTYHKFSIKRVESGWVATVVLDV